LKQAPPGQSISSPAVYFSETKPDLEPRFVCQACGKRGADVRPDFNWNRTPVKAMATVNRCRQRVNWRTPAGE